MNRNAVATGERRRYLESQGLCNQCGLEPPRYPSKLCTKCLKRTTENRTAKNEAFRENHREEANRRAARAANSGQLSLVQIVNLRDGIARLELFYDKLAQLFAKQNISAVPPEKPHLVALENFSPTLRNTLLLGEYDDEESPDWPLRKLPKILKSQKDWDYEKPHDDVYKLTAWRLLQTVPWQESRSHQKKWREEKLPAIEDLEKWLYQHMVDLVRDHEAMMAAVKALVDLTRKRAPHILTNRDMPDSAANYIRLPNKKLCPLTDYISGIQEQ